MPVSAQGQPTVQLKAQSLESPGVALSLSRAAQGETVTATFLPAVNPLSSRSAADAWCAKSFGPGWHMAEFHDGEAAGEGLAGWDFWAENATHSAPGRFRVAVNDQAANPWDSSTGNGMTWQVIGQASEVGHTYLRLGRSEQTDAYQGDAGNSLPLPVACLHADGLPRPPSLPPVYTTDGGAVRSGWSQSSVKFTAPVNNETSVAPVVPAGDTAPAVSVGGQPATVTATVGHSVSFTVPKTSPPLSGLQLVEVGLGGVTGTATLDVMNVAPDLNNPADQKDLDQPGGLLVTLQAGTVASNLIAPLQALGFEMVETIVPTSNGEGACARPLLRLIDRQAGRTVGQAIEDLNNLKTIYQVDPNGTGIAHLLPPTDPIDPILPVPIPTEPLHGYLGQMGAPTAWAHGWDGNGVTIAVLDTGVQGHQDGGQDEVSGRITFGEAFVRSTLSDSSDHYTDGTGRGHGTPVASLAAGRTVGVAPKAHVLSVRVCNENGACRAQDIIQGVCHVLSRHDVDTRKLVLNLSLGGKVSVHALVDVLREAVSRGALVAVAAGNEGPGGAPHYPAADQIPGVMAVAALNSSWNGAASFSTRGTYLDLAAPGEQVQAACVGGCTDTSGRFATFDGTSFASPIVAGALALARQKYANASPEQIVALFNQSVVTLLGRPASEVGAGMLDLHFLSR